MPQRTSNLLQMGRVRGVNKILALNTNITNKSSSSSSSSSHFRCVNLLSVSSVLSQISALGYFVFLQEQVKGIIIT